MRKKIRVVALIYVAIFLLSQTSIINAKTYGSTLCKEDSNYTCYTVKRGDTWKKLFEDDDKKDLVMRVNRTNKNLYRGMEIAIPNNLDTITKLDVSPFPSEISAPGSKVIKVSLDKLAWGAYDSDGKLVNWGPVSGGKNYCPDVRRGCRTVAGNFAIYEKRGAGCRSTKFPVGRGGAPMPYCMFFHKGYALHGSPDVPGYNASHGCVRLFKEDARWLNEEFTSDERRVPVHISRSS